MPTLRCQEQTLFRSFISDTLGLPLVMDQGNCRIYEIRTGAYLGFCERPDEVNPAGLIVTIVADDVDGIHQALAAAGVTIEPPPRHNAEYGIYHAFYRDPDGHRIEIQRFDDPRWEG